MTISIASTSVELPGVLVWQDELLSSPLISMDTARGVAGFTTMLQEQHPSKMGPASLLSLRSMPNGMGILFFIVEPSTDILCC